MYEHERSLVEKFEGRPFVIIGVNTDEISPDDFVKLKEEKKIIWRSFLEGSRQGPIVRSWPITGFPTVFIIDDRGIIRAKNKSGSSLDRILEQLVSEAENRKSS